MKYKILIIFLLLLLIIAVVAPVYSERVHALKLQQLETEIDETLGQVKIEMQTFENPEKIQELLDKTFSLLAEYRELEGLPLGGSFVG